MSKETRRALFMTARMLCRSKYGISVPVYQEMVSWTEDQLADWVKEEDEEGK